MTAVLWCWCYIRKIALVRSWTLVFVNLLLLRTVAVQLVIHRRSPAFSTAEVVCSYHLHRGDAVREIGPFLRRLQSSSRPSRPAVRHRRPRTPRRDGPAGHARSPPGHHRSPQVTTGHGESPQVTAGHGGSRIGVVWCSVPGHGGHAARDGGCRLWSGGDGRRIGAGGVDDNPENFVYRCRIPVRGLDHLQLRAWHPAVALEHRVRHGRNRLGEFEMWMTEQRMVFFLSFFCIYMFYFMGRGRCDRMG